MGMTREQRAAMRKLKRERKREQVLAMRSMSIEDRRAIKYAPQLRAKQQRIEG